MCGRIPICLLLDISLSISFMLGELYWPDCITFYNSRSVGGLLAVSHSSYGISWEKYRLILHSEIEKAKKHSIYSCTFVLDLIESVYEKVLRVKSQVNNTFQVRHHANLNKKKHCQKSNKAEGWAFVMQVPDLSLAVQIRCFCSRSSFDPQHDKTNKMTCAISEDSDKPSLIRRSIRSLAILRVHSKDSDQIERMPRLV